MAINFELLRKVIIWLGSSLMINEKKIRVREITFICAHQNTLTAVQRTIYEHPTINKQQKNTDITELNLQRSGTHDNELRCLIHLISAFCIPLSHTRLLPPCFCCWCDVVVFSRLLFSNDNMTKQPTYIRKSEIFLLKSEKKVKQFTRHTAWLLLPVMWFSINLCYLFLRLFAIWY